MITEVVFWILAVVLVSSALAVVLLRNIFRAALILVLSFFAVAGIYITLHADFLAAAQETKESFVEIGNGANDLAERIADRFSDMQFTVGVGFNVDDLPGAGTSKSNAIPALAKGGIVTRPTVALIGEKETEAVVPLSRLGAGGGSLTINLEVDGDRMATKVIKLTPRLLRELGLD